MTTSERPSRRRRSSRFEQPLSEAAQLKQARHESRYRAIALPGIIAGVATVTSILLLILHAREAPVGPDRGVPTVQCTPPTTVATVSPTPRLRAGAPAAPRDMVASEAARREECEVLLGRVAPRDGVERENAATALSPVCPPAPACNCSPESEAIAERGPRLERRLLSGEEELAQRK